jgi:UPF0755 protein
MTREKILGTALLLGSLLVILAGILLINAWLEAPLPIESPRTITIERGMTGRDIGSLLKKNDVINATWKFRWAIWIKGAERNLSGGTIKLKPPLNYNTLINKLQEKRPYLISVQLIEGWPSWRIFKELSRKLNIPEERFYELFDNRQFLNRMGINSGSLEGYLFPDTYYISADADARRVLRQLLAQFREIQRQLNLREQARHHNMTLNEAVTLASIIAREAGLDREREMISAVFHNRLDVGQPLQADPTVLYPLGNFQLTITHSMLNNNHNYNTYRRRGLPPTPISNPGKESLQASVNPANVSYRYFVSRGDGSHVFSETLEQHQEAVRKFQR